MTTFYYLEHPITRDQLRELKNRHKRDLIIYAPDDDLSVIGITRKSVRRNRKDLQNQKMKTFGDVEVYLMSLGLF